MWNRKMACSRAAAAAAVAAAVALVAASALHGHRLFTPTPGIGGINSRTLNEPYSVGAEFQADGEERRPGSCKNPYVYTPEHRHRVEVPPSGTLAGNVRAVFDDMSSSILNRWGAEYEDKLFGGAMAWSDGGKVVEDKMLNAVLDQESFVAAFTGNSIAAGHDCLYEQSYPVLLNATMGRLMAAAGVGYTAINVAMGNTRIVPYSYCVDAHAGLDADIISWSFGMEMGGLSCESSATAVELFIRSSTVLPRRPAVLVMDAQGDQASKAPLKALNKRNANYLGFCGYKKHRDLMEVYRDFGLHNIFASSLVREHTVGDERFSADELYRAGKHYPRPMRWHPGPMAHELVADMLFMHYARVFLAALERLEAAEPGLTAAQLRDKRQEERMRRQQQQADGGEDDAPASGMSWKALRLAVGLGPVNPNVVSIDIHWDGGENAESRSHGEGCSFMGAGRGDGVLPPAEWCSNPHCEEAGDFRCANTYYPLGGNQGSRLLNMIVVPENKEGGGEGEHGDGSHNHANLVNGNKENLLVDPSEGRWAVTLNEVSKPALDYMANGEAPEGFHKPIDTKWVLVGDAASGPIEIEFYTSGVKRATRSLFDHDNGNGGNRQPEIRWGEASDGFPQGREAGVRGNGDDLSGADAAAEQEEADKRTTRGARKAEEIAATTVVGREGEEKHRSRVTVCKPDFIDRVRFDDEKGVRFSVDGVITSVVPGGGGHLATKSCALLAAEIGPGLHRLTVEPLRKGEPFVAISHVIYPA